MQRYPHSLRPPLWARGGHAQTLLGHVLPSPGRAIGAASPGGANGRAQVDRRIEVELADGDRLVAFGCAPTAAASGVRVHLFHGLSGDVNSEYLRRTAACMTALGHEVWAVNHRGCGAGAGLARGTYHSGSSADMRALLCASRADAPELIPLVIGFSLSGNIALKLAAEYGDPLAAEYGDLRAAEGGDQEGLPAGLIAVNPPVDLERTSLLIQRGLNRIYERRFVLRLRGALRRRAASLGASVAPVPPIPSNATLWDLDELVTAPLGGFADARDYYRRCSTHLRLDALGVPAVVISTRDDPFVCAETIETAAERAAGREDLLVHLESTGGHVGYLEGRGPVGLGYGRWLDGALGHYVGQLLAQV